MLQSPMPLWLFHCAFMDAFVLIWKVGKAQTLHRPVMELWEATYGHAYNKLCWSECHQGGCLVTKQTPKQVITVPYACTVSFCLEASPSILQTCIKGPSPVIGMQLHLGQNKGNGSARKWTCFQEKLFCRLVRWLFGTWYQVRRPEFDPHSIPRTHLVG